MEISLYCCAHIGRTTSEKTMEDVNISNTNDDKTAPVSLANLYRDLPSKLRTNGYDRAGEPSSPRNDTYGLHRPSSNTSQDENHRKRINPLRIHLGKRPFVDNSFQYYNACKKRKTCVNKSSETSVIPKSTVPRVPKLIPKRIDRNQIHNVTSQTVSTADSEHNKPVPRLVPKSQVAQFKKSRVEKGTQLNEYVERLGLQPMVKFKCRKCCSMSFKTLAMLKEHQLVCRAQAKEPTLSPDSTLSLESSSGGPSRVTKKVYLCSACGTYYENWNLFLHMRNVHNRHICLFCLGMFSKAEKLSLHLTHKHRVQEYNYDSKDEFFSVYSGTLYLMCCVCDEICSEKDDFFNHDCNNVKPKPVPMLISKNAVKSNNMAYARNYCDLSTNVTTTVVKDLSNPISETKFDKKDKNEDKFETAIPLPNKVSIDKNHSESFNIDMSTSPENSPSKKDTTDTVDTTNSVADIDRLDAKLESSSAHQADSLEEKKDLLINGDEDEEYSDRSESPIPDDIQTPTVEVFPSKPELIPPIEKEKEGGIKLKLSLNNANSPVIINSTVDPTVGQQHIYKPPSRVRRPPKRYEKDILPESVQPKTPSIKMTICDKSDSPFVKTTIYENNQESTLKTILNNNPKCSPTPEHRLENIIRTTIYDNKPEDVNNLNRIPKLTVRVPKGLLDKDSSSEYSSDSEVSDKLTVDENNTTTVELTESKQESLPELETSLPLPTSEDIKEEVTPSVEEKIVVDEDVAPKVEPKTEPTESEILMEPKTEQPATNEIAITELTLDRPLDKYPLKDLIKVFLSSTIYNCIYCNHVRKIAVNCEQLALHMVAEHRFSATVDSITAEELMPETITAKVKLGAEELRSIYINLDTYDSVEKCETVQYDHIFECFQCYFKTAVHKDLYLHNRKMHQKTILLCVMCKSNFYSYSELLCHLCPGTYDSEYEIKFRCCLCNVDSIPSSFRLMVHLRKTHHTCDVCLEFCHNQARLSNHVWKHKLHHLCYRCGIAYRNKPDITNHLFWKHGTESVLCKKCLQKKWPHVYHFCTPPAIFICEECTLQFTKAVYLKVHKRFHLSEFPHSCTEEECIEKFVSKKLLMKHIEDHRKKLVTEDLNDDKPTISEEAQLKTKVEEIPIIDLVDDKPKEEIRPAETKPEIEAENACKKSKKKKVKDKDALLLDVNLPALNLSESDSSDESDSGIPPQIKEEKPDGKSENDKPELLEKKDKDIEMPLVKVEEKIEQSEEKPNEQQVLDIWDNFKKYQAKVEKQKEKTPPLVPIRKHVCESDHDYCLIPTDLNGDDDMFSLDKKKNKKSKKRQDGLSTSSSSSSDSDSSCSCGSNCSCSSSSGSSSSSSSDSDSSDESGNEKKRKQRKSLPKRRISNGSNVDVMGMSETPILIPDKPEPLIAETDLETDESDTDEEFYDEHPQQLANKVHEEKRNQLMLLASVAPSDGGSLSGEASRCTSPVKEEKDLKKSNETKEKPPSSKKKSKKKKKSKNSRKHGPIKINIPKDVIMKPEAVTQEPTFIPNKITISLQSNTVQVPETPKATAAIPNSTTPATAAENKRSSKRRRVPNKFYGYSSDEEIPQTVATLKPQQPPKLEWRKEDLPSPVTHKAKKEIPSSTISHRLYNYTEPIRLTTPIPDPEPPRILMNTESMESSDSDTSDEGALEIHQPNNTQTSIPVPPPSYLNSGTSSLPYPFQRPAVRQAREGESVYCYCRCPYDEVSEMIACDAEGCTIEWFHFECVGIMVPPKGKWYCPECRKNQNFSGYR